MADRLANVARSAGVRMAVDLPSDIWTIVNLDRLMERWSLLWSVAELGRHLHTFCPTPRPP